MNQVLLQQDSATTANIHHPCSSSQMQSTATSSSQAPSLSSPIEMDKCQLSQLIHQKDTLTLQELESLRKQIESQQQIQMTIKNNNPYKVHIQCKHFKSKKCTFQITFKAINVPTSMNAQLPTSNSSSSSSHQTNISTGSPNCSLQTQLNNPQLSSSSNTSPSSPIKKDNQLSSSFQEQMLQNQANTQQTTSSSSLQGEEANAAAKQQMGDSCASVSLAQKASSAEINLSSQMLLQNSNAIKEEDVQKHIKEERVEQVQEEQQQMEDENNESFLNMIDEQQMSSHHYSLMSPSISPFVFNIISSNHDINYLSLDGVQGDSATQQQQQQQPASNAADKNNTIAGSEDATTAIEEENVKVEEEDNDDDDDDENQSLQQEGFKNTDVILFKLSNCRLQHRNHPVMSDEEYKIHLAKRWLEGHSEKIERIYEEIREKKGMSFKITPKIIKKCLLDTYDIDIYAKCTEKAHKKFLKKKLDNLMKAIRQKERAQQKSNQASEKANSATAENKSKRSSSSSSSSQTRVKNTSISNVVVSTSTSSGSASSVSQDIKEESTQQSSTTTEANECQQQMQTEAPTSDIKIEEEINPNSIQNQQQLYVQQPKVYKEEWESFLELDVPYRLQPAH